MNFIEREIVRMSMEDLTDVDGMFARHAQVNMSRLPASYAGVVEETRKRCMERVNPVGVICSVGICGIEGPVIRMEDGRGRQWQMESGVIAQLLKESQRVLWFAATLQGFEELVSESGELMEQFFLEAWGSAFASRAGMYAADYARSMLDAKGLYYTSAWEPGQHGFDIYSQREAFAILEPADIGLALTESMLMIPAKSVSGLFGICREEDRRELIPCDYCRLRDTCPSSYNVGAKGGCGCGCGMEARG